MGSGLSLYGYFELALQAFVVFGVVSDAGSGQGHGRVADLGIDSDLRSADIPDSTRNETPPRPQYATGATQIICTLFPRFQRDPMRCDR